MIPIILFGLFGAHGFGAGLLIYLVMLYGLDAAVERLEQSRYERSDWGKERHG